MKWPRALTGQDNETPDILRILGALSVVVFLFLAIWAVVHDRQVWDAQSYGTGLGLVLAAIGGGLWMKKDTEPKP